LTALARDTATRFGVRITTVVAVGVLVAGCSSSSTDASDREPAAAVGTATTAAPIKAVEVAGDTELYAAPEPVPAGPHGTLLRYQRIDGLVEGAKSYRIMYLSESLEGKPIVVTGQAVVPDAAPPPGGRVTLANAHGTTGGADQCAPSKNPRASEVGRLGSAAVTNNWVLTETDYEGMGTPGRHPYLVGPSEGRSVIDSVTAAGQLPGASTGDKVLISGYSQGGHGALWANQVAAEWAPKLDVVGTFAGAPATEIDLILNAARSRNLGGFLMLIVAGFQEAYPEADPALILTERGVGLLDSVDKGCTREVFAATANVPAEEQVRDGGPDAEPWKRLAAANSPGHKVTGDPVLIVHSDQDETVPAALSAVLRDRMCRNGQTVERRVLEGGGGHGAASAPAFTQGITWLKGRLEGAPPVNDCAG
jgi:pimeloyl-ACP methyl ester carboxylesterase